MKKFFKYLFIIFNLLFVLCQIGNFQSANLFAQQPTQEWIARYPGTSTNNTNSGGISIKQDSLGFIYVLARFYTDSSQNDYCVLKYNISGNLIWSSIYGTPGGIGDDPEAFIVTPHGDVYITGNSSINFSTHITTVKLNSN